MTLFGRGSPAGFAEAALQGGETMMGGNRVWTGVVFLAILVSAAGCPRRTIRQVMAESNRYAQQEVGIEGDSVESYLVLGRGAYRIDDGTDRLWVVSWNTRKGVPRKGARVYVKGNIRDGYDLQSVVKLRERLSSGLVMLEKDHKAR